MSSLCGSTSTGFASSSKISQEPGEQMNFQVKLLLQSLTLKNARILSSRGKKFCCFREDTELGIVGVPLGSVA